MTISASIRHFSLLSLLSVAPLFAAGCASEGPTEEVEADGNEIVDVPQTPVERQSIGNCWLYAEASWVESMNLSATGAAFDTSQSYWTYWHWFDQIAGGFGGDEISTGGNFSTANNIIRKYGLMAEKDFVPADTENEMSSRQKSALDAMNLSLKSGALKDASSRRNKALVRAELDRAWGLSPAVAASLTSVFGKSVTRTFTSSIPARNAGTAILSAKSFPASYKSAGGAVVRKTLFDAMNDWRQVSYFGAAAGRSTLTRIQRALHDRQPVIVSWFVDFNAMENVDPERRGSFNLMTLAGTPGRQGGHMTVFEDYEATLPDGTVLKAGATLNPANAADKAKLDRALSPATNIKFFRIKNSWGASRVDRAFAPGMPGYHDLYMDYLNGPIAKCAQVNGETDTSNCTASITPLQYVILPPGY